MTCCENINDIQSQNTFSECDFHSQFSPEYDNSDISNSVLFDIMSIIYPSDEEKVNSSSNNQLHLRFTTRKIKNRGRKIDKKNTKGKLIPVILLIILYVNCKFIF